MLSQPALVVDDYGQIGKVTAQRAVRDERAAEIGLAARISFAAAAPGEEAAVRVELELQANDVELPDLVVLRIVHPTREELDVTSVLSGSRGHYAGSLVRPPGRLYLHLGDPDATWRLVGELAPGAAGLRIDAGRP